MVRVLQQGLLVALLAIALSPVAAALPGHAASGIGFPQGRVGAFDTSRVSARLEEVLGRDWAQLSGSDVDCARRLGDPCHLELWRAEIASMGVEPERLQVGVLNRLINRVPFRSDAQNWGRGDYWAAPGEFFARGGDCEDYAIAKYAALRRLGIAAERMRIVVLGDELRGRVHAGLVVRLAGEDWFLDSLADEPRRWADVHSYRPIYSLNEVGAWFHLRDRGELGALLSSLRAIAAF